MLFAYVAPVVAVGSSTNVYQRHGQYQQHQTLHTYLHFIVVYTGETDDGNDEERAWRLAERWKFDEDDSPAVGPEGPDEQDRALLDDYEPAAWRRTSPANTTPSTPSRAQAATPPRLESPTSTKYRPGAIGGGRTWRDREAKKAAGGVAVACPFSLPRLPDA